MFGGDELEDLRFVARPFQQRRTQSIGDELRVALQQDAVAQRIREHGRRDELRAHLLLAARRDDDQFRARRDALGDGVIRGGVARVQGDKHLDALQLRGVDGAGLKAKFIQSALAGDAVAEVNEFGSRLDAANVHRARSLAIEPVIRGEGEVALAAAHVDQMHGLFDGWGKLRVSHERGQHFHEFVDLPELRLHALRHFAAVGGDAQPAQPRALRIDASLFGLIVGGRRRFAVRRFAFEETGVSAVAKFQVRGQQRGEEIGVTKVAAHQFIDQLQRFRLLKVLRHIAGAVAIDELQARPLAQGDGADEHVLQRKVATARPAEGELHE